MYFFRIPGNKMKNATFPAMISEGYFFLVWNTVVFYFQCKSFEYLTIVRLGENNSRFWAKFIILERIDQKLVNMTELTCYK